MKPNDLYTLRSKTQFIDSLFVFFFKKNICLNREWKKMLNYEAAFFCYMKDECEKFSAKVKPILKKWV